LSIADKILQVPAPQSSRWSTDVILPYLIRRQRLNEAKDLTDKSIRETDKRRQNCLRSLFPWIVVWANQGEGAHAASIARQCEDGRDRYRLTLEAVAVLARRGGAGDIKAAADLLQAAEAETPLLSSKAPDWLIPGIATLLMRQNRPADARNYILKGFD